MHVVNPRTRECQQTPVIDTRMSQQTPVTDTRMSQRTSPLDGNANYQL